MHIVPKLVIGGVVAAGIGVTAHQLLQRRGRDIDDTATQFIRDFDHNEDGRVSVRPQFTFKSWKGEHPTKDERVRDSTFPGPLSNEGWVGISAPELLEAADGARSGKPDGRVTSAEVAAVMKTYDENKNGRLHGDEWERFSNRNPQAESYYGDVLARTELEGRPTDPDYFGIYVPDGRELIAEGRGNKWDAAHVTGD